MKQITLLLVACAFSLLAGGGSSAAKKSDNPAAEISAVLTDLDDAASKADYERYFSHFAADAVFLGTDATEHWTLAEFKTYTKARFANGSGWTYMMASRHIYFSEDQNVAWFDELLVNARYGQCRGTGVLVKENGKWKVSQYHLTIPIPNELAERVVAMINKRAQPK